MALSEKTWTDANESFTVTDNDTYYFNFMGGNDKLIVNGNAANQFHMGEGNDFVDLNGTGGSTVWGDGGNDTILGSQGYDVIIGGDGHDVINADVGKGDWVDGGAGNDAMSFDKGGTFNAVGGTGNDSLYGGDGWDILEGGAGNDRLDGGAQTDNLYGGLGNDIIYGGAATDGLTGNAGADTFLYKATSESNSAGYDVVFGFESGQDKIDLSAIDADTTQAGNQAFSFFGIGQPMFTGAGDLWAVQQGNDLQLFGDVNGDGNADFQVMLMATLGMNPTLTSADFIF
jgi:Ca2+-binding RTX toxin-like protein